MEISSTQIATHTATQSHTTFKLKLEENLQAIKVKQFEQNISTVSHWEKGIQVGDLISEFE